MSPSLSLYYSGNLNIGNSVFFTEGIHTYASRLMKQANFFYLKFGKFCHSMFFSNWAKTVSHSINRILSSCGYIKMIWSYTNFHIAFVTNYFSFRNFSEMEHPRKSMRFFPSSMMSWVKFSVSRFCFSSHPKPTRFSFSNVFPESCFRWDTIIVSISNGRKNFHFEPPVQDVLVSEVKKNTDDSIALNTVSVKRGRKQENRG